MKKVLLIVAAMIFTATEMFAQDFSFGARIGMNVANIGGDWKDLQVGEVSSKLGLKAGVVACFPLVDNIYLEPGAFFSMKGSRSEISATDTKTFCNLDYIEIPLSGVYKYEINSNLSVRGHLGPYFAFGMCGKTKTKIDGKVDKDSKVGNFKDGKNKAGISNNDYSSFDFGLNFGGGIEFSVCYLGVQYGLGLTDFNRNRDIFKNGKNLKFHNNVFSVDFGINF